MPSPTPTRADVRAWESVNTWFQCWQREHGDPCFYGTVASQDITPDEVDRERLRDYFIKGATDALKGRETWRGCFPPIATEFCKTGFLAMQKALMRRS